MKNVLCQAVAPILRGLSFDGVAGASISLDEADDSADRSRENDVESERSRGSGAGVGVDLGTIGARDIDGAARPRDPLFRRIVSEVGRAASAGIFPSRAFARDDAGTVHHFSIRPRRSGNADGSASDVTHGQAHRNEMAGKTAIVTGGAQGFGEGLVRALAHLGCNVWIADLNIEGAASLADELNSRSSEPSVHAFKTNVSDEESVVSLIETVVRKSGGIDLFVSNAGVLRAGGVMELSKADFDFVTSVNYSAFFLCVKHAAPIMALQNRASLARAGADSVPYFSDIVQINSKSGLEGSNRNGAYAGSKFGGIGLVQSFALELVADSIKVNAICPGNFFEGPLWSDPDRGLFVQYLRAGKVPGAKSIHDVKKFYESKVPMNRGCREEDVVRALLYAVGQKYETGQAIPVTGGQVMLS